MAYWLDDARIAAVNSCGGQSDPLTVWHGTRPLLCENSSPKAASRPEMSSARFSSEIRRASAVLGLGLAMVGCTATPPPAVLPTSAAVVPAISLDGIYRGTSTRFRADRRDCPHPGLITLYVQDGQFEYRWTPQIYVPATIDPDGTVRGQGSDVTLAGHRDGNTIDGDITNGACGLHFTARKTF